MNTPRYGDTGQLSLRSILSRGHLRLVLFAVLLAAVSLTLSGLFLIRGYSIANVSLAARTMSYSVEPAVLFGDSKAVEDTISSIAGVGGVRAVEVLDGDGNVIAQWDKSDDGVYGGLESIATDLLWPEPEVVPILYEGQRIGMVRVAGSAEAVLQYTLTGLIIALCCLGLTVLATRILARRLEEEVVAPLEHVGDIAHEVSKERAFQRRVSLSGIAEIDRLGKDFNALLAELEGWHDNLTSENVALAHRAEHDPLTGLGNRDRFDRLLVDAMEYYQRTGRSFGVLFIDTDRFKSVNDSYGHDAGDNALCEIAARLLGSTRVEDKVFRVGGDEFAVVLDDLSDKTLAAIVIDRIEKSMAVPIRLGGDRQVTLSLSIGQAIYPADGDEIQQLMRVADRRMYERKRGADNIEM